MAKTFIVKSWSLQDILIPLVLFTLSHNFSCQSFQQFFRAAVVWWSPPWCTPITTRPALASSPPPTLHSTITMLAKFCCNKFETVKQVPPTCNNWPQAWRQVLGDLSCNQSSAPTIQVEGQKKMLVVHIKLGENIFLYFISFTLIIGIFCGLLSGPQELPNIIIFFWKKNRSLISI